MSEPATVDEPSDVPGTEVLVVALPRAGGEAGHLAIPADAVREVARLGRVTRVPGAPADVVGLTAVRGQIVPVLDVAPPSASAGLDAEGAPGRSVLLLAGGGRLFALTGVSPLRVARVIVDATTGAGTPARRGVEVWSGRLLPVAGTARLPEDSRHDAVDRQALLVLDVEALVGDVIDDSHGGR